jgi:hypothetical protein
MRRPWSLLLLTAGCGLVLARPASAQVDYDAIRTGTSGCPELTADPAVGDLAAFLCRPADRTSLDLPITNALATDEVRAGAFSIAKRMGLLALSRGAIGESEFARLEGLLFASAAPSQSQQTLALSLETEAAAPGTPPALAAAGRAQAASATSAMRTSRGPRPGTLAPRTPLN